MLLITHFMEEAERLCDRVIIIDRGSVIAEGSPRDLIASVDGAASLEDVFVALTSRCRAHHGEERGGLTMSTTTPTSRPLLSAFRSRGFGRLLWTEFKVYSRGSDLFWALLFPTVLLVGQAALAPELREIATGDTWAGTPFYGVSVVNVVLPAMLTIPIAMTALAIMPVHFGGFREKGILRRFSATPMRPQSLFAVHSLINVTMSLGGALIALIVSSALFKIVMPDNVLMVLLGFVLGMAALMALGSVIAAWVPKASTGTVLGNIIFFPLLLTSGVFTVIHPGTVLYQIARISPLGAASQLMSYGWFGGDTFPWVQIIVLIAWAVVLTPIAVKLFKWS